MSIESIDDSKVTAGLLLFLEETADLSPDDSGNIGVVKIGDGVAPTGDDGGITDIDVVTRTMASYIVVSQVAIGAIDRANRSGYAGGTPSSRVLRYQITAVSTQRDAAQMLATTAAARVCDVDANGQYAALPVVGHFISRRERVGPGVPDREGALSQWTELIDLDVSLDS